MLLWWPSSRSSVPALKPPKDSARGPPHPRASRSWNSSPARGGVLWPHSDRSLVLIVEPNKFARQSPARPVGCSSRDLAFALSITTRPHFAALPYHWSSTGTYVQAILTIR